MAQQGQGGKPPSGPPGPPPPRPPKTPPGTSPRGTPTATTTPGDVTPARGPPPAPKRVSIGVGSTRPVPPPATDPAGPPPAGGKPVKDSGPSASSRPSLRDPGPSPSDKPSTSARTSVREPAPSASPSRPVSTRESGRISVQEAGTSTSAKVVKLAAAEPSPAKPPETEKLSFFKRKKKPKDSDASRTPGRGHRLPSVTAASALQNRAKTNRILYTTDEEVREALVEFSVFIIFLILTSLVVLSVRHTYMFYFNDTMKRLFTNREMVVAPSVTVGFEKLITVPDWWDYLKYNFLVTLHGDLTFMDNHNHTSEIPMPPPVTEKSPEDSGAGSPENSPEVGRLQEDFQYNGNPYIDLRGHGRAKRQASDESSEDGSEDVSREYSKLDPANISAHHLEGRVFLYENLLLGPPRLRQIRVRKESCYVNDAFIRYFNTCYAAYSAGAEDRKATHKGSPFRTMNDLDSTPIWTVLAFYRTGGYTVNLAYEKETNVKIINDLKEDHWLDRGSRLCLVEFNLFNENTDIFQSVKLIAEIPPTGGVIPQAHLQTVKKYSFFTDRSMLMTVIYIFWYIMVIYYTIYEITELRKSGIKIYFFSMLNILDCAILLGCYLALVYNIWHSFKVMSLTARAHTDPTYQSLDVLCFWNIIYVDMMAILAFLVWIKIFKFISFNKTLVQFTTTLKRCSKDLAGFSLMFGIVFLAYAQLGLLLFGTKHPDFRNFITSILTMIRMILGDFQYNLIEQANRVLGPIYFLTYILLVFFILLNMFLAIIMETYNTVKGEITQGRSHLGSYIYRKLAGMLYWITHCGRKRRPHPQASVTEDKDAYHDVGAAQDEAHEMRKHMTPAEQQYFQDIPQGENQEMVRLNNRVGLLEEILEKLINNMDDILKRIEKDHHNKKK
ncbi:polycystic kidney disease 2-like 2 protein [Drosophila erecta]|uniref:Uncharacterized protein n=1 Tax=Drosophila erecta TaxID=7220 RepID=B3N3V2_DROER|nr:polycystic kidney disease 2-like 2 protein [Drosophila erecta]EDV58804.1 uncharacterized protein Dere_GG23782 [Drosophila erecta]